MSGKSLEGNDSEVVLMLWGIQTFQRLDILERDLPRPRVDSREIPWEGARVLLRRRDEKGAYENLAPSGPRSRQGRMQGW